MLLAVYLLVYQNQPATIDGEATLAVASNLWQHGTPDIMILGSADGLLPPISRMGTFGVDGLLYAKKGIVPSLLLLPFVGLAQLGISVRAAAMLFNPIVTILTALTIYACARQLQHGSRTALLAAVIFGLGTLAIVYTRTLFGEPLAGLLLLAAFSTAHSYRQNVNSRTLIATGLLLGLACGVNITYALVAPMIGLYALGLNPRHWHVRPISALAAPIMTIIGLLLGFNMLRFGSPLTSGYNFAAGEGFTSPFGLGVFGLLLSPYRGLFWYSPILLLIVPGAFILRRQRSTIIILTLLGLQVVTYATWWSWHGGIVWGPRFLLPVMPLLMLLTLPIIAKIGQQRFITVSVLVLSIISIWLQIPALIYDFVPYTMSLYRDYAAGVEAGFFTGLSTEVVYRLDLSPIVGQFRVLLTGSQPSQLPADSIHISLVLALLGIALLIWRVQHQWLPRVVIPLLILASLAVVLRQSPAAAATVIEQQLQPAANQIVAASTAFAANLLDYGGETRVITTHAPTSPEDPLAAGLWDYAQNQGGLTWFITWFPPARPENWQEQDLWQHAAFVHEIPFIADHRSLLFDLTTPVDADQTAGWQFGPIQLTAYGLNRRDDGLQLTLDWTAVDQPEQNYSWFVHLLDNNGQIIQQQDRQPQGDYSPTTTWQPGDHIKDHLFFPIGTGTDTAGWQIRIGFVDPITGDRLPTIDPVGEKIPDNFMLLPL